MKSYSHLRLTPVREEVSFYCYVYAIFSSCIGLTCIMNLHRAILKMFNESNISWWVASPLLWCVVCYQAVYYCIASCWIFKSSCIFGFWLPASIYNVFQMYRLRQLEGQAMLERSQGMMNMCPWLIRQLMLVGRSNQPFRGILLLKVSISALLFM